MPRLPEYEPVLDTARRFADSGLRSDDSLFTPGRAIWSRDSVQRFHYHFVEHEDFSSELPFAEKLHRQLEGATPETVQFAAELLFVHFLAIRDMGEKAKRDLIEGLLALLPDETSLPSEFDGAVRSGLARFGTAHMHRYFHLRFLTEFLLHWKTLSNHERDQALSDPWQFKRLADSITTPAAQTQRQALLYLLFPDDFEPIVSLAHKSRIVERWAHLIREQTDDVDRQLRAIRDGLTDEYGADFNIYDSLIRPAWDPNASQWDRFIYWAARFHRHPDFDQNEREYKVEGAKRMREARDAMFAGSNHWIALLRRAFGPPMNLTNWRQHGPFLDWCSSSPDEAKQILTGLWDPETDFEARLNRYLAALPREAASGPSARLGTTSLLLFAEDVHRFPFFRTTVLERGYRLTEYLIPPADISEPDRYLYAITFMDQIIAESSNRGLNLRDRLDAQSVLWAVTNYYHSEWPEPERSALERFRRGSDHPDTGPEDTSCPMGPASTDPIACLAGELFVDTGELRKIEALLEDKRQVIFYGPPGTGKTYIAMKLAEHLAGDRDRVALVQFHPAYAYEDFVEGFRPRSINGMPGFELVDGPLKSIAARARADREHTHILIIDEINRGNVARVFGELYFLLEYRDHEISLQYSAEPFSLPENLFFIGTMNTADRSIALIDAALRRRFYFVPFFPQGTLIDGILRRWWLQYDPSMTWVADLVDEANARLGDHHAGIGPSYFMRRTLSDEWVSLIWEHQIEPYLEEHFFGEPDRLEEFRYQQLRAAIHPTAATIAEAPEGDIVDPGEPSDDEP